MNLISNLFDRSSLDEQQAKKIARCISRTLDLPLLGLYDSANDPDPVEDPGWARFLLGDGWIAIFEGVCN